MPLHKLANSVSFAMNTWEKQYGSAEAKSVFHRSGRAFLKAYAKQVLKLETNAYEVRSCEGGPAVLGEVTLHTDNVYIQLREPSFDPTMNVLFRKCASRKDYMGGSNHWCHVLELLNFNPLERLGATFFAY